MIGASAAPSSPHPFVLLCGSEQLNFPGEVGSEAAVSALPGRPGDRSQRSGVPRPGAAAARARTDAGQAAPLSQPAYSVTV